MSFYLESRGKSWKRLNSAASEVKDNDDRNCDFASTESSTTMYSPDDQPYHHHAVAPDEAVNVST